MKIIDNSITKWDRPHYEILKAKIFQYCIILPYFKWRKKKKNNYVVPLVKQKQWRFSRPSHSNTFQICDCFQHFHQRVLRVLFRDQLWMPEIKNIHTGTVDNYSTLYLIIYAKWKLSGSTKESENGLWITWLSIEKYSKFICK